MMCIWTLFNFDGEIKDGFFCRFCQYSWAEAVLCSAVVSGSIRNTQCKLDIIKYSAIIEKATEFQVDAFAM